MFELQPMLENEWVRAVPLQVQDFARLFEVAADPLLWEQHPNKNRYQREVFQTFFQGALESRGAFCVHEAGSGDVIGCTRFYDLNEAQSSVGIGYTYLARRAWGGPYNRALKSLMLDHAFQYVNRALFHVGPHNRRSRRAVEKLGGSLTGPLVRALYGEPTQEMVEYVIQKNDWRGQTTSSPDQEAHR